MKIPFQVVLAFTSELFSGNPAGVCILDEPLSDSLMQKIAKENGYSETAFVRNAGAFWQLRWFAPGGEVDLCGHATLATGAALFEGPCAGKNRIEFQTKSGMLYVSQEGTGTRLTLDFPSRPAGPGAADANLIQGLGLPPQEVLRSRDYLVIYATEEEVASLKPDFDLLGQLDRKVIVTAPGRDCDFVSRFFAPTIGIPEDPVTGSAHCTLTPYWAGRLGKPALFARQLSARRGELRCRLKGERVEISGQTKTYFKGIMEI